MQNHSPQKQLTSPIPFGQSKISKKVVFLHFPTRYANCNVSVKAGFTNYFCKAFVYFRQQDLSPKLLKNFWLSFDISLALPCKMLLPNSKLLKQSCSSTGDYFLLNTLWFGRAEVACMNFEQNLPCGFINTVLGNIKFRPKQFQQSSERSACFKHSPCQ